MEHVTEFAKLKYLDMVILDDTSLFMVLDKGEIHEAKVPLEDWRRDTGDFAGDHEWYDVIYGVVGVTNHVMDKSARHHGCDFAIVLVPLHNSAEVGK